MDRIARGTHPVYLVYPCRLGFGFLPLRMRRKIQPDTYSVKSVLVSVINDGRSPEKTPPRPARTTASTVEGLQAVAAIFRHVHQPVPLNPNDAAQQPDPASAASWQTACYTQPSRQQRKTKHPHHTHTTPTRRAVPSESKSND